MKNILLATVVLLVLSLVIVRWRKGSQLWVSLCSSIAASIIFLIMVGTRWLNGTEFGIKLPYFVATVVFFAIFCLLDLLSTALFRGRGEIRGITGIPTNRVYGG